MSLVAAWLGSRVQRTNVVSTTSWTLPHAGRPLAMTSMCLSTWRLGHGRRAAAHWTGAPASRQTRAAAHFFWFLFFTTVYIAVPAARPVYGMRLAKGGCSAESAKTSLSSGVSPSTLAVPDSGSERRLAAKDCAAAMASCADQRDANAAMHAARCAGGAARARLRARSRTNSAA